MFWGTKKKEDDREKQLKHLKAAFPSMRRPNNDDKTFELRFTVDNQYNTLRVIVPDEFPQMKPVYNVLGPVTHHWLDGSKLVVGCRKLNDWNPKTSSILEITEDILAALLATRGAPNTSSGNNSQTPTQRQSIGSHTGAGTSNTQPVNASPDLQSYGNQQSTASNNFGGYPNLDNVQQSSTTTNVRSTNAQSHQPVPTPLPLKREESINTSMQMALPGIPSHFPELDKLTEVQLERLLKDGVALDAHLSAMESVQAMESLRDMQRETNASAASKNIVLGEEVQRLNQQAEVLQGQVKALHNEVTRTTQLIQKEDMEEKEKLQAELRKKVAQLDEVSDSIGDGLIRGTVDLATFKRDFLEKRSQFYTLKCRLELAEKSNVGTSATNVYPR